MNTDTQRLTGQRSPRSQGTALVVPTLNAGEDFNRWLDALKIQTVIPERLLLIDSSSTDDTVRRAQEAGFEAVSIERSDFSHGGTRQMAVERLDDSEIIIFLTQDAVLASRDAIETLLEWFEDPKVAAAYGRQLPRPGADVIEAHARLFNYPEHDRVKTREDIPLLGIKTAFISNSFAAYRRDVLVSMGGFPRHTIQNEDTFTASRMILSGWKVAYSGQSAVYHSHALGYTQEFKRYFDIGVFHARDPWIRQSFGQASGEGRRFVFSELRYVFRNRPGATPSVLLRSALKLLGYKLGNKEQALPLWLKKRFSANKSYWHSRSNRQERAS
jgi:rhamnosyltransferase